MKKLLAVFLCVCLALTAAGCNSEPLETVNPSATTAPDITTEPSTEPSTEPYNPPEIQQPMHAIVMPTVSESTRAEDGTVIFTRSYQKIQLILNGSDIENTITADLQARMNSVLSSAADIEDSARNDYSDPEYWTPYFVDVSYTPTRIDQSVISLFGNHSSYIGGTHPSLVTESVTYDLSTGNALTLGDILVEGYTGEDLCALIAEELSAMADELYYDYETVLQDYFSGSFSNITTWYFSRTGLCFHFSPYVIAPYASGTIIAEVPYENLSGVLKEQYLPADPIPATGSIYAEMYIEDNAERFPFLANVELDEDGTQILLHPDAAVTDVRIETGNWYSDGSNYIPVSTVFAADSVGLGNGIVIKADLSESAPVLRLVYRSGEQEVSAFIVYDAEDDSLKLVRD